jgi:4-oxalocrotonate tautomerase
VPLVCIDLLEGRTEHELEAIADAVHQAMTDTLAVPARDRFQIITEHRPATLRFDRDYLDIARTSGYVLIRLTMLEGRSAEVKRAFQERVCELLGERAGVEPGDVMVVMVENQLVDWSFGLGQANLLERPREQWR